MNTYERQARAHLMALELSKTSCQYDLSYFKMKIRNERAQIKLLNAAIKLAKAQIKNSA